MLYLGMREQAEGGRGALFEEGDWFRFYVKCAK